MRNTHVLPLVNPHRGRPRAAENEARAVKTPSFVSWLNVDPVRVERRSRQNLVREPGEGLGDGGVDGPLEVLNTGSCMLAKCPTDMVSTVHSGQSVLFFDVWRQRFTARCYLDICTLAYRSHALPAIAISASLRSSSRAAKTVLKPSNKAPLPMNREAQPIMAGTGRSVNGRKAGRYVTDSDLLFRACSQECGD